MDSHLRSSCSLLLRMPSAIRKRTSRPSTRKTSHTLNSVYIMPSRSVLPSNQPDEEMIMRSETHLHRETVRKQRQEPGETDRREVDTKLVHMVKEFRRVFADVVEEDEGTCT